MEEWKLKSAWNGDAIASIEVKFAKLGKRNQRSDGNEEKNASKNAPPPNAGLRLGAENADSG